MDKKICKALRLCGIPQSMHGYKYLAYAIELVVEDEDYVWQCTKRLYPAVADNFDTTTSAAERAMRHAIQHAFDIMPLDVMDQIFGNTINPSKGKATVSQFIAALSEYVQD